MSSFLKRLFATPKESRHTQPTEAPPSPTPEPASPTPVRTLDTFFQVVEVSNGEFFAGPLFMRRFSCNSFPQTPKHFVALYQGSDSYLLTLGYVHFEMWENNAMCGGLVINERAWRLLPTTERKLIRQQGGVAEMLLRSSFDLLPDDLTAIWGYVGDPLALKVDLRVGFQHTEHEYLMVIWRNDPGEEQRTKLIQRVAAYGPF